VRYLRQAKLGKKIGLSFGVLIALIILNAAVVGLAAWSIAQQIGHRQKVAQVFTEVDRVRLMVSSFVNTHSRDSAQQVFVQLASARQHVDAANLALDVEQLKGMPSLLDDFRLHFQKYVVESDQKAALESRAFMLGQRLAAQLHEAHANRYAGVHQPALDSLQFQMMAFQWGGQGRQPTALQTSLDQMANIRRTLDGLQVDSQTASPGLRK